MSCSQSPLRGDVGGMRQDGDPEAARKLRAADLQERLERAGAGNATRPPRIESMGGGRERSTGDG